jgi:hypothetical protein
MVMADLGAEGGTSREELLERVALMEAMICEGRRATCRYGWIFVLWGLVDLVGLAWQWEMPHSMLVWPVVIASGFLIQGLGFARMRRDARAGKSVQGRSVGAVWSMMGAAVTLYVAGAMIRHLTWQVSYVAAILMMLGMAHAISAMILRWRAQAVVAAVWWAGGVAAYFVRANVLFGLVVAEMLLGLVAFGMYVMVLEHKRGTAAVAGHA